jgi:hypothetical protein
MTELYKGINKTTDIIDSKTSKLTTDKYTFPNNPNEVFNKKIYTICFIGKKVELDALLYCLIGMSILNAERITINNGFFSRKIHKLTIQFVCNELPEPVKKYIVMTK